MHLSPEKGDKQVLLCWGGRKGEHFLSPGLESILGGSAGVFPCEVYHEMSMPKITAVLKGDFV
jgi:hypothetical protein